MLQNTKTKKPPSFEYLWKSYLGFLEGTGKSRSTISSYTTDLGIFRDFLQERNFTFQEMRPADFENYAEYLKKMGLKTNTRRRKLLTVRSLYRYALTRKKIRISPAQFLSPPSRLEKLPWIPSEEEMQKLVNSLPKTSLTALRDRILVLLLIETGLAVAELSALKWSQVQDQSLKVEGKYPRKLELSKELLHDLSAWREFSKGKFLFPGFNRHGITSAKMTPRGVELVFKKLAQKSALPQLKPKTLRHYAIIHWIRSKLSDKEILRRIGVSANYSLEAYRKRADA